MNWKEESWLLAVFEHLQEIDDEERMEIFLERNPEIFEILERQAEEAGVGDTKKLWEKMKEKIEEPKER